MPNYDQTVGSRYHIYNSLFLNLPFRNVSRTGILLPLLQQYCTTGFAKGKSADEILKVFFKELVPTLTEEEQFDLLFSFIQYIERQVALFDSVEDAAFEQVHNLNGKGTVPALLLRTKIEKKEADLKSRLDQFSLRIVLTAHPTQFYPGNVLGILTDLENAIRVSDVNQINLLLQQLGKTGFINQNKPTPYDEALSLCWYLENVFYHSIPEIVSSLAAGLEIPLPDWKNDRLIVIGFWPGGDRDGNPFVTSEITVKVASRLQESILKCYYKDIRLLRRRLTFHGIAERITAIEQKVYGLVFRQQKNYTSSDELLVELNEVRNRLVAEHDGLFLELLDALIIKVRIFGFHFAALDIRQDSRKHDYVWMSILDKLSASKKSISSAEFQKLPSHEQINYLLSLKANLVFVDFDDPLVNETIQSVLAIKKIQQENGAAGCHRYVISNCQSALHLMEVFVLARLLIGKEEVLDLDIVPLFETIDDLAHAPAIMEELYAIPAYREHLARRKNHQTIMLGFSDGTKDGGYLRANWSIFRAKENLTAVSRQYGLKALFFDGRGGPPARGGGNTHDFYASLGDTIEHEEVQVTVQGQTISSNFGKIASSKYNLEQLISAGLEGSVFARTEMQMTDADKNLLDHLADQAYTAYLDLKHHPKFVPYLEKVTPLSFFGDTNIGSRPVKRSASEGLKFEDLRAIPFVGSWAMMKQNIPGFYGVGSALNALQQEGKERQLKELYQNSLFFRTLLGNSMMSLTKTFYEATAYLGDDPEFGEFWEKMYAEFILSKSETLDVSGLSELMGNNPTIRQSVHLREQIVLPLIAIQQSSLMNLRNLNEHNKKHEQRYSKLIIRSMFGIINAARNSA
ncbi:MAG: phosphoenolpyruvate carboxylase [Cytophagales bacterium]|jgi:phosphoenolpyruvate carboxylase|nr:phosphoenolpyruvate carboxylase [Cytophagales bacterium]MCA6386904.1 phosphoenolpyruvate carboxylase [Cytophagales bacterium]MCA6391814.1 phosphoenolpyruvate carboxylase [Cytophagales bacterium]MCA6395884.1 phosphoenolpyruvate carboxylase [Cytophagales bacterium]MCA6399555.1 phosphoenolpyruvate carboxylase [Cytophagales bacterium]